MGQLVGAQGQVKEAKKIQNTPTCDVPTSKRQTKKKKCFFDVNEKTCWSVEDLNSSLALAAGDLRPKKGALIYWLARSSKSGDIALCFGFEGNRSLLVEAFCSGVDKYWLAGEMWPATTFYVDHGSIQKISSNLKFPLIYHNKF